MSPESKKLWLRAWKWFREELRWLVPGIGVKRWILVILAGTTLLGIGLATLVLEVYRSAPDTWWLPVLSALSLRTLERPLRVLIFGGIGVGLILVGTWGLNRSLLRPFIPHGKTVLQALESFRRRERGPRIVAIGGGHGLAALLRGIKDYTHNITAIVTVADDGGSSGELRRTMGILPPGDIRNCLAALSNDEALMAQVFQYRFSAGAGLSGHSFGNLFISALTDITGSFEEAVAESGRVLAVHGRVLPASLHDVRLGADIQYPSSSKRVYLTGESRIPESGGQIKRVWLEPANAPAFPPVIAAILSADLIIIGPGSLYTSILPDLLVPDLAEALRASRAIKFFICNLATEPGETTGFQCGDHLRAIEKHVGKHMFDLVICNKSYAGKLPEGSQWVIPEADFENNYAAYFTDLDDPAMPGHHLSGRLAQVIMDLFYERTGPLANQ